MGQKASENHSFFFFRGFFIVEIIGDPITVHGKEIKNSKELRYHKPRKETCAR